MIRTATAIASPPIARLLRKGRRQALPKAKPKAPAPKGVWLPRRLLKPLRMERMFKPYASYEPEPALERPRKPAPGFYQIRKNRKDTTDHSIRLSAKTRSPVLVV